MEGGKIVNKNGSPICHAKGCRKHIKLIQTNGGFFCEKHADELKVIRDNIELWNAVPFHYKSALDIHYELNARKAEQEFRKYPDYLHSKIIEHLENVLKLR